MRPVRIRAEPCGIAIRGEDVSVADTWGKPRIQILDSKGGFRSEWKFPGWNSESEPYLEVGPDETVRHRSRTRRGGRLDSNGNEVRRWSSDDSGQGFATPTGIALDRKKGTLDIVNTRANKLTLAAKI